MTDTSTLSWRDGMAFDVEVDGHHLTVDAAEEHGGSGLGPRPKPLVLSALAGCTGMDVVSILRKKRITWDSFAVKVDAALTEEHPKYYQRIHITYTLTGAELDRKKIERAVQLSQQSYCGVSAMLGKAAEITYEIVINGSPSPRSAGSGPS